ncbi:MAG: hypothetical protein AB1791_17815 [Chloroflexota bacterium]
MEISEAMHDIIVAISRKAVDDRMQEISVTRQDFSEVKIALRELSTAQARTEKRVGRLEAALATLAEAQARTEKRVDRLEVTLIALAEAQARTEKRVEELAEAQARSEERLTRVEAAVERLAEAQARTEERLTRVEAAVERLTEAQARSEERLTRVEAAVERLAEAQARTEKRVEELAEAQSRTEAELKQLGRAVAVIQTDLSGLKGRDLERTYGEKAYGYFSSLMRRARAASLYDVEDQLEAHLSDKEISELRRLDLLIRGKLRAPRAGTEVWLALEVSAVVDRYDVERAQERAALLRRAGLLAVPAAAGEEATQGAEEAARARHVLLVQDGRQLFWEEALADALAEQTNVTP